MEPVSPLAAGASLPPSRVRPLDVAALLAVYLVWGSTYWALRVALAGLPPFILAGSRFVVAGAILYTVLRLRGVPAPRAAEWPGAVLIGFLLPVVGNGAVTWAEQWVGSGLAALVVATMPMWAALFAHMLGERSSRRDWIGLLLGFGGVALLQSGGELRANVGPALALLLAPLSWAFGSAINKRVRLPSGAMATAAEMLAGGVILVAFGLARGETLHRLGARPLAAWIYLTLFGSLLGFSAYNHLMRHVRPALATSYAYVNPLIALVIGAALAGEQVTPLTLVAAGIIVAGIVLITTRRNGG
jgi:drug/metabolite transporter (DMT)-like permease